MPIYVSSARSWVVASVTSNFKVLVTSIGMWVRAGR